MRRTRRWSVVPVLMFASAVLPGLLGTQSVAAIEISNLIIETQAVQVLIDDVAPVPVGKKSTLLIRGRVANSGEDTMAAPHVRLRLSPQPLASRGEVATVLDGTTDRQGLPVPGTSSSLDRSLEPGQQAEFRIKTPMSRMQLPDKAAVFAFFVEVVAGPESLGSAGVLVPWFPKGSEYLASKLALTWPLTQRPAVANDQLVLDPALPREFAADGRLSKLLDVGATAEVSWLVDSATVETARELAEGYRLRTGSGFRPGDQSEAAERFGKRLSETLTDQRVALPGYAFADVDALYRSGLTSFVVRSASLPRIIGEARLEDSVLEEFFVAPGGFTNAETLQVLVDAGIRNVILSDTAFPPDPELNYTPTGAASVEASGGSLNVLLSDSRLNETLARDLSTSEGRSLVRQMFLAELAMITLERPSEPRRVVAQSPDLWDPPSGWTKGLLSSVMSVPWIDLIQLGDVNQGDLVERSLTGYGKRQRRQELPRTYVREIVALEKQLESVIRIVDDPAGFGESFTLSLQRAGSSLWRDDIPGRNRLITTIAQQLDDEQRKVRVVSTGNVTLAGDSGILPLTVANDLDRSVTVKVNLQTDNQIRLLYEPPGLVKVAAAQKVGLEVPIQVLGSQPMEVTVVMADSDGNLFDDSAKLQVQSTASTQVAAVVAGIGALGFLILLGLRIYRRRQRA